jgi:von Willebrand factor type A domain
MRHIMTWASAVVLMLASGTGMLRAAEEAKAAPKNVDVVICLDVSNSMDGLIASAKVKLWDIVNDMARIKPTPRLRVGLYSYGNDGYDAKIGWIRKDLDLTTDLDELYKKLNALTTNGGTEYVTRVCRDALKQQKWANEKDALRLIFVCGNEPASQDPVVKLKEAADLAKEMDVVINPIFCGPADHADARDWKEYAQLCGGRFASINQDKGAVTVSTPMDKDLAALSAKINRTYVTYGRTGKDKQENQAAQDANALKNAPAAAAGRAFSKANGVYQCDDWDLVDRMKSDPKFDIKKLKDEELCEELRKLKPAEREEYVKKKAAERETIQKEIAALSEKRSEYLKEQQKKNPSKTDKAFDDAVRGALREQAKAKGITIPE